ncbi:branched-chain amino acid transport system II carrier protein [Lentibacillus lipolyticus]|nr:branched-chain amino acid transport system II carrier protein [Lentibacillus lipolyticus]
MKTKLTNFQLLAVGLMLLAMFLGAGNTIFAPIVGQQAGSQAWMPMVGFLLTGVGLVLLAIIALAIAGGRVETLAERVHPKFGLFFSTLLFLTLGPIYVIPRTTSVVYEISIIPNLSMTNNGASMILFGFSFIFIVLTVALSLNPNKFVDRLGKVITPVFSILLILIVAKSIITPMGAAQPPVEPYIQGSFMKGFTEGYLTMDVLAAFVFGGVFIQTIKGLGVTSKDEITSVFIKAGLITVLGLTLLHISLAWIGASSVEAIGRLDNGGAVLAEASRYLLGQAGVLMIGTVILLTGLTTNIACLSSVAEYFDRVFPKISYKNWIYILACLSLVITNFGLNQILNMATPVLFLLYPMAITLIALALTNNWFKGYRPVYIGSMTGAGIIAVFDAIKQAGLFVNELNQIFSFIPLFSEGGGWILPALIGGIVGYLVSKLSHANKREYDLSGEVV